MKTQETLGSLLLKARKDLGDISQEEAAKIIGANANSVLSWEKNRFDRMLSPEHTQGIYTFLRRAGFELTYEELMGVLENQLGYRPPKLRGKDSNPQTSEWQSPRKVVYA